LGNKTSFEMAMQLAAELLMLVAEHGGDPMMARIAMMKALHRREPARLSLRRRREGVAVRGARVIRYPCHRKAARMKKARKKPPEKPEKEPPYLADILGAYPGLTREEALKMIREAGG
jgi:hypothetical protein